MAAFGKHPGWNDHIPGIGLETEALAYLKQKLYVDGIGRQVDSGAWEKLEAEKLLEGFDHLFLWQREEHVLLGQLWSSVDRKGRSKYPMVLCLDGIGISVPALLNKGCGELDRLRLICQSVATPEEVIAACSASQERLRDPGTTAKSDSETPATLEARRRFLEHPDIGPARLGLLRVLHELRIPSTNDAGRFGSQTGGKAFPSCHLRVPLAAGSSTESLSLWSAFFQAATPKGMPVLLISRKNTNWLDVIAGEPVNDDFFCFGAGLKAIPLTTEIPYELSPEAKASLEKVEERLIGKTPVTPVAAVKSIAPTAPPAPPAPPAPVAPVKPIAQVAPVASAPAPPPRPPVVAPPTIEKPITQVPPTLKKQNWTVLIVLCAVIVIGVLVLFLSVNGHNARPVASASSPAAMALPATNQPVAAAGVNTLDEEYEAALKDARTAFEQSNYAVALAKADAALALKVNDPAALKVKTDAQAQQQSMQQQVQLGEKYQRTMETAQAAFNQADYPSAFSQAELAMQIRPGDPAAQKLKTDAKAQLDLAAVAVGQQRQQYESAMQSAQAAFNRQDFSNAVAQAGAAMVIKPNDAAAAKLKADAQAAAAAAASQILQGQQYDSAMTRARAAYGEKDYSGVIASADAALNLRTNDAAALALKNNAITAQAAISAQTEIDARYTNFMNGAQAACDAKDYPKAIQLSGAVLALRPGDLTAIALQKKANDGEDLQNATAFAGHGQFDAAQKLCQAHAGNPDFDALAGRLKVLATATVNAELEVYLVRFGLLDPKKAKTSQARKETEWLGELPIEQRDQCMNEVDVMRKAIQSAGAMDPATEKQLDELKKAIDNHL
jgi:hypothetical protein